MTSISLKVTSPRSLYIRRHASKTTSTQIYPQHAIFSVLRHRALTSRSIFMGTHADSLCARGVFHEAEMTTNANHISLLTKLTSERVITEVTKVQGRREKVVCYSLLPRQPVTQTYTIRIISVLRNSEAVFHKTFSGYRLSARLSR